MEEQPQEQPNRYSKYIAYLKTNKYNAYFIGAIAILLILIISMIILIVLTNSTKKTSNTSTSPTPTQSAIDQGLPQAPSTFYISPSISQISPSVSNIIITTPNPTQAAAMENQTQPQITPNVAAPYTVSAIKQYGNDWAIMKITNPTVGSANVIVKKVNGTWTVMLGPGTQFDQQDINNIGAPQQILNDANTGI